MGFLQQLRQEAAQLQAERGQALRTQEAQVAATEEACTAIWQFLRELSASLNVIEPPAAEWTLDGKAMWPPLKQTRFRFDARRKRLHDREVFDYLVIGWEIEPQDPQLPRRACVSVNFLPELQRVEQRLQAGQIRHERKEERHPDKGGLLALHFEHERVARASVLFTPDHERGVLNLRLSCVGGMEVVTAQRGAHEFTAELLDELAKRVVGQPSTF